MQYAVNFDADANPDEQDAIVADTHSVFAASPKFFDIRRRALGKALDARKNAFGGLERNAFQVFDSARQEREGEDRRRFVGH